MDAAGKQCDAPVSRDPGSFRTNLTEEFMNGEYFIRTYTGKYFDLAHPTKEKIDIVDITMALSKLCRWTGQCRSFYSVAEHSINVSSLFASPRTKLAALLHDAAEAYIGDINSPLKSMLDIAPIEHGILRAIEQAFDVDILSNCDIKQADRIMLITEARDLMGADIKDGFWAGFGPPLNEVIWKYYAPPAAAQSFYLKFRNLISEINNGRSHA